MGWYSAGTISVTNGNKTVTGSSTAFVANVKSGFALVGPDGRVYEIDTVDSATQLTLKTNYQGSTASGQSYSIFPTQGVIADLATQAASLITSFATVRDGVGAGLHPDGTVSVPAIRFSSDQDTGLFRPGSNIVAIVTGGVQRLTVTSSNAGVGTASPNGTWHVKGANNATFLRLEDTTATIGLIGSGAGLLTGAHAQALALRSDNGIALGGAGVGPYVAIGTGVMRPSSDNAFALGGASNRWSVVYAGTGAINTSDEREKTWRGELTEAEYEAGLEVIDQLGFYQWNDAIAEKGADGARYHFGVRAQQVWAIFAEHELVDPIVDGEPGETPYSFLCFDKWDEQSEPILEEDGEPTGQTQIVREAGSRFGVRYNDLTLFLLAVQARRQAELEARIEALEGEGGE